MHQIWHLQNEQSLYIRKYEPSDKTMVLCSLFDNMNLISINEPNSDDADELSDVSNSS